MGKISTSNTVDIFLEKLPKISLKVAGIWSLTFGVKWYIIIVLRWKVVN